MDHKSLRKRAIVDLSSLVWTALRAGKDSEFGYEVSDPETGKVEFINTWRHGYEFIINSLTSMWDKTGINPVDTILVYETGETRAIRKHVLPSYKETRGKSAEAWYREFNQLVDETREVVRSLGGTSVTRANVEGDDMIGYLVSKLQGEKLIQSNDKDMAVLLAHKGVSLWYQGELVTKNPFGPFDPKLITLYKALVGDSSDNIPGAKGFGPNSFAKTFQVFGEEGLFKIDEYVRKRRWGELEKATQYMKELQRIVDSRDAVFASYAAADLFIDVIENINYPIEWTFGVVRPWNGDERLKRYMQQIRVVKPETFDRALRFAVEVSEQSGRLSLDLETTTPPESDEWLAQVNKLKDAKSRIVVDPIGSTITTAMLTFGPNDQFTLFFPFDHTEADGIENLSEEHLKQLFRVLETTKCTKYIHNVHFELPVLYQNLGRLNPDKAQSPLLNNAVDTMLLAAYHRPDEAFPSAGLKDLSKWLLDYEQVSFEETTQGRKMDELSASEVLSYGVDDTVVTIALANAFRIKSEVEGTWDLFLKVEVDAAYLTSFAFAKGTPLSGKELRIMERNVEASMSKAVQVVHEYLQEVGYKEAQDLVIDDEALKDGAGIKRVYEAIYGEPFKTRVRLREKVLEAMKESGDPRDERFAHLVETRQYEALQKGTDDNETEYVGRLIGSSAKLRDLMYVTMELPVRWVNAPTQREFEKDPETASAVRKFMRHQRRPQDNPDLTPEERKLIIPKGKADQTAVEFALKYDLPEGSRERKVINAIQDYLSGRTQITLFFNNYRHITHWKTGMLHANVRQCAAETLRHTANNINVQQMSTPRRGDIRKVIVSQYHRGVIIAPDWSGVELRIAADVSKDPAFLSCYVGSEDELRDVHSLTASAIMPLKWGRDEVDKLHRLFGTHDDYELFVELRKGVRLAEEIAKLPDTPKLLRDLGKTTNFASQYGGQTLVIAAALTIPVELAEILLAAKVRLFKEFERWKEAYENECFNRGYAETILGIRRNLRGSFMSGDQWRIAAAKRQASNHRIQGSCGEIMRMAMGNIWRSGIMWSLRCNFLFPVHDELVVDSHPEDAMEVARVYHEAMTVEGYLDKVPVIAEMSVGRSFYHQNEVEFSNPLRFDQDAFAQALAKIKQEYEELDAA